MKNTLVLLCLLFACKARSQNVLPVYDQDQYGFEIQPQMLQLDADKNLCELKELVNLHVRMTVADKNTAVPYVFNYKFRDPSDAPWTVGDFRIVSGDGKIVMTDKDIAQLQMPETMPKEKCVTVQVTLNPVIKKYQQVQLFTTIYLQDNDNVIFFNSAYLNINMEKYVVKYDGGALTKSSAAVKTAQDKKIAAADPKIRRYTMHAAGADVTATQHGFDLSAITSNAKAVYAKEEDVTTILLDGDNVEMANGLKTGTKRMFMVALSFPGKSTGTFTVKTNKKISATITLPKVWSGVACTCADDPDDPNHTPPGCHGGTITITKYDGKMVEGFFNVHLESQDYNKNPPPIFYSTINGKFKVPLAN